MLALLLLLGCGLVVLGILLYPRSSSARRRRQPDDKPYWLDKRGY